MAMFWELLEIRLIFVDEPECRLAARRMCSHLKMGGYSKNQTGFVALWSRSIFCFQDVNLFACGMIQPPLSLPCTNPSTFFLRTANRDPMCGVSHQTCAELCFPFSFHACWANSDTRECVLALGVWGMYLLFHCLINCRGPNFWLCLSVHVHVTVYYCKPRNDHTRTWPLIWRVFNDTNELCYIHAVMSKPLWIISLWLKLKIWWYTWIDFVVQLVVDCTHLWVKEDISLRPA